MGNLSCPSPNWAFPMDGCHGQKAVSSRLLHSPGQQGICSGAEMTQLYLLPCLPSLRIQLQPWLHIRINGESLEILLIDWALADQWTRNPWGPGPCISSCKNLPTDSDGNCYPSPQWRKWKPFQSVDRASINQAHPVSPLPHLWFRY